jgi:hypothetical protein
MANTPTTNETITINLNSYSRIDGCPIFTINENIITQLSNPLEEYQIINDNKNPINIKNKTIINPIEDNIKYMTYQSENENEIINFILKHLNMTHDDLNKQDAYKMIIRQIKLNKLIN